MLRVEVLLCGVWLATGLGAVAWAEQVKLPVTADNSIMAHPDETRLNAGASSIVKLKTIQHTMLVGFDAGKLRGWWCRAFLPTPRRRGPASERSAMDTVAAPVTHPLAAASAAPGPRSADPGRGPS